MWLKRLERCFRACVLLNDRGSRSLSDHLIFVSTVRLVLCQFSETHEGGIIMLKSSTRILKKQVLIMCHRESFQFNCYKYYRTLGSETPIES